MRRVLLIDDDEMILRALVRRLREVEHTIVETATDADVATGILGEDFEPTLVVTDWRMRPGAGGEQVLEWLARWNWPCPAVVFSADDPDEIRRWIRDRWPPVEEIPVPIVVVTKPDARHVIDAVRRYA